jgi:protease-4
MKKLFPAAFILILIFASQEAATQTIPSYYSRDYFLMASPGSFERGLIGFANPASIRMMNGFNTQFMWSTDGTDASSIRDWGIFSGLRGLGFSIFHQQAGGFEVMDYNINLAAGDYRHAVGFAYTWSRGDESAFGRERFLTVGTLTRYNRYLSVGMVGNFATKSNAKEGIFEAAIRPMGNSRVTVFGDFAIQKQQRLKDVPWSAGGAVELLTGLKLVGRYFDSEAFTLGISLNLGYGGFSAQSHFDANQDHVFNTYGLRAGEYTPNFLTPAISKNKFYYSNELKGRVDYQKYVWFDPNTHKFLDIIRDIQAAGNDPRIAAIALNLSSARMLPEHAWEIRQELKKAQAKGKKVIAFIDYAEMTLYHLASVADEIVMDPQGMLYLEGYLMGHTFLRGTLDKLGLGIDEWRFFKYKSAAEVLSRKDFSEADREQRQAYVDDKYESVRSEICQSRKITPAQFDDIIDNKVALIPSDAMELGLVDELARWSDLDKVMKSVVGKKKSLMPRNMLHDYANVYTDWGNPPHIAVVYGLGECAMDRGINARKLEKVFNRLKDDRNVKAVVFRVDSPGGDGMASDVVAEALRKCTEKKPVIVSQGQVAGSGGYWISMYGDTIVAGPSTITGSIGVYGLWIYDKGFSGKLGMTSDYVKRGEHADLRFGVRLPLLGVQVPERDLTEEEHAKMEALIRKFYAIFVDKVAQGRNMDVSQVEQIAQGRFYSGIDGKDNGLVDEIGGLSRAIQIARTAANIPEDRFVKIDEIPENKGLINFGRATRVSVKNQLEEDWFIDFLRTVTERPGYPLHMLLPGDYPVLEE